MLDTAVVRNDDKQNVEIEVKVKKKGKLVPVRN
jgi:hypothetical protein